MKETLHHDAWQAGDHYEAYMGRWSRQLAPRFLDWLGAGDGLDRLDVGCGTGALSAAILAQCNPRSLIAIDPSVRAAGGGQLRRHVAPAHGAMAPLLRGAPRLIEIDLSCSRPYERPMVELALPRRSSGLC
jgi:SAM-dependent methyltransferase